MRKLQQLLIAAVIVYFAGYVLYRQNNTKLNEADGKHYVVFATEMAVFYKVWLPLAFVDEMITGTGAHLGPFKKR